MATSAPPRNDASNTKKSSSSFPNFPSNTLIRADPPTAGATAMSSTPSRFRSPVATRTPPVKDCSYGKNEYRSTPVLASNTRTCGPAPGPGPTANSLSRPLTPTMLIVTWAMATEGLNPDQVTKENLAKVRPILAKWLPLVKVYDSDSPKTALLNGDVDLGVVWSGEAAILINEQPGKFTYHLPKEGGHMFIDNLAIPKGAEHVDTAHKFINYLLRPEVAVKIATHTRTATSNAAAEALLPRQLREDPGLYPPEEILARAEWSRTLPADSQRLRDRIWTRVKSS